MAEVETVDVQGKPINLVGSAHDINRVLDACKEHMSRIESQPSTYHEVRTVKVPPPDDT